MNSLRTRILFIFTLFAGIAVLAVFLGAKSTFVIGSDAERIVQEHLPMVHTLGKMEVALINQDAAVYRYLATRQNIWKDVFEKERDNYTSAYLDTENLTTTNEEENLLRQIDELYIQYENHARKIILAASSERSGEAKRMLSEGDLVLSQIRSRVDQIVRLRQGMSLVHQENIGETLRMIKQIAFYFFVSILFFFIILAFYLWQYLVKPLSLLVEGIRNFTRGRLDIQIPPIGKDELGELQDAFNEMAREISNERKRLKSESQSDPLTGLFNMRYFRLQLVDEFSRSQRYTHPLSLLLLDVDYFKDYNDRNGHPAGDIVLKEIARILIRNVRGTDVVARYGGEEFVVLLPETTSDAAHKVAEKIRKAVEIHHFPFQETIGPGKLTISVGLASYPDMNIASDQDLVEAADKALYHAKKNGRNRVSLYSQTDGRVVPLKKAKAK